METVGFEDVDVPTLDSDVVLDDEESILSLSLAETLHSSFRHVDQLTPDGLWVHGAVGI